MEKRTPDLAKVATLAKVVSLESVCWRELTAKRHVEQKSVPADLECSNGYEARGHRDTVDNEIVVLATFRFRATKNDQVVAEVTATLALRYSVADGDLKRFDPELVEDFASTNGVYNAWPYWRECLQATTDRIGLHGILLPVFRLVPAPEKRAAAEKGAGKKKG